MTQRLLLVRHCASSGQEPDAPLTAQGFEQANALARQLAPLAPDRLISSPFLRARQSIAPLADALGIAIAVEPRLAERRQGVDPFGDWREGLRASFADLDRVYPAGESSRAVQQRGRAAVEEIVAGGHRLPVLATHGNLLSLLLRSIDGRFGYAEWEALTNPDVFVLTVSADAGSFARWDGGPLTQPPS